VALARSDLGVEITIDVDPLRPQSHPGEPHDDESATDHVTGTIRYPNGVTGVIVFAKAAMAVDVPQDARAFREVDPRFPNHTTADQFFDERTFEAYRGLGAHAARGCVQALNDYRAAWCLSTF